MKEDSRYSLEDFEGKAKRRTRRAINVAVALLAAALVVVGGWQAWEFFRPPDIAAYATQTVQLIGLTEDVVEVSPEQLAELSCYSVKASNASDRAGQGNLVEKTAYGYGPLLNDVVGKWGHQVDDFDRLVVHCLDGYEVVILPNETLDGDIYLSIARGKDALAEDMRPMRLIMPEMPPGQWAYGIESITFETRN